MILNIKYRGIIVVKSYLYGNWELVLFCKEIVVRFFFIIFKEKNLDFLCYKCLRVKIIIVLSKILLIIK